MKCFLQFMFVCLVCRSPLAIAHVRSLPKKHRFFIDFIILQTKSVEVLDAAPWAQRCNVPYFASSPTRSAVTLASCPLPPFLPLLLCQELFPPRFASLPVYLCAFQLGPSPPLPLPLPGPLQAA